MVSVVFSHSFSVFNNLQRSAMKQMFVSLMMKLQMKVGLRYVLKEGGALFVFPIGTLGKQRLFVDNLDTMVVS